MTDNDAVREAVRLLRGARRVVISSGAGISKESGVPTFRDAHDGLWARFQAEELATPWAFERDPDLVWSWYMYRYELIKQVKPNPGHYAVAEMEDLFDEVVVLEQNVDGLHWVAGSTDVVELHGNIQRFKCSKPCRGKTAYVYLDTLDYTTETAPPCPHCPEGGFVRPDVVWFGESLPTWAIERAYTTAARGDVMLVVGTSGTVQPAASLPSMAREQGARIIEVNPQETLISRFAHVALRGPSGEILPALVTACREENV
ncbi:MAG: NAD-dependent deacetylase [Anaerolineae bacterium]